MSSNLLLKITEAMKASMRLRDNLRLTTIRMLLAAVKQKEIDERLKVDDRQVIEVIEKLTKQRKDSHAQYQSAGRQDLADRELAEIGILAEFMPAALGGAEVTALIKEVISAVQATSIRDMAKVMGLLKERACGQVDMAEVGKEVKRLLAP